MLPTHPGWLRRAATAVLLSIPVSWIVPAPAQDPDRSTLRVPAGHDSWGLMPNCSSSIWVWVNRADDDERRQVFEVQHLKWIEYHSGQPVLILERRKITASTVIPGVPFPDPGECVGVRFADGDQEGWVEKTLVVLTAREIAANAAAMKAEQDRQASIKKAEQDRQASLAKMSTLSNGAELIFVGADRKCSEQFVQAAGMEGLEKRKRLAELISYGCGFTTRTGSHISVLQSSAGFSLVKLEDGKETGRTGWIPTKWMSPPRNR
jgi:hypothetical protein